MFLHKSLWKNFR